MNLSKLLKKAVLAVLPVLFIVFSSWGKGPVSGGYDKGHNEENVYVKRVVDGDTFVLENGLRVRMIGIDTPELHHSQKLSRDAKRTRQDIEAIQKLGKRAYEFTRNLIEAKQVKLEFDVERRDKYGRLLAYVYLSDGTFVNAEIVHQGYASLMTIPPNVKNADLFVKLYKEARQERRGLWK